MYLCLCDIFPHSRLCGVWKVPITKPDHLSIGLQIVLTCLFQLSPPGEIFFGDRTDRLVSLLFDQCVGLFQLDQIQKRIRVTGKNARTGRSVHRLLSTLRTFRMMVTVDDRTPQLGTDQVKLITEFCHLVSGIFIAGNDLIDRVDDDGEVLLFLCPVNQFWSQTVHRHRFAAQVPDIDAPQVFRCYLQSGINILEPVQTGRPVQFQIDIQHPTLCTLPAKPAFPLGDRDAQLDQRKGFARLTGTCDQHFVSLPQHSFDERR